MSINLQQCGNCDKEVAPNGNEFFVFMLVYGNIFEVLAVCPKCFQRIPESVRTSLDKTTDSADVVTICRPENIRGEITMHPLYSVRKNTVKFCLGGLGQKLWPPSVVQV